MTYSRPSGEPPLDRPYAGAPFGAAVRRFWKKAFTFSGRASRSEFWLGYLGCLAWGSLLFLPGLLLLLVGGAMAALTWVLWVGMLLLVVSSLFAVVIVIPMIALSVRRLHDANQSGALYLLNFIPVIGGVVLLLLLAQPSNPAGSRFDVRSYPEFVPPAPAPSLAMPVPAPMTSIQPMWAPASAVPTVAAAQAGALEETRKSAPLAAAGWLLALPDGRVLPISGAVYVGRAPAAPVGEPSALLVPVDEAARSMSKTHGRISLTPLGLQVTDLHSTNGTVLTRPGHAPVSLAPGVAALATDGATVRFGDWAVELRKNL
ncbi:MAG: DUF805 domain-containing protein [Microbacterium sp.]|uniref:DUF805 domain-containing protein n=1 Tax=Microbacterium sp. TaxID=51671 RepID=UPI0026056DFE|nr:DUF805 domain-containing protein [Microbacterium sp.]MCX6501577.1 DUF805 domain-containing protein [Microbacterium sp.]